MQATIENILRQIASPSEGLSPLMTEWVVGELRAALARPGPERSPSGEVKMDRINWRAVSDLSYRVMADTPYRFGDTAPMKSEEVVIIIQEYAKQLSEFAGTHTMGGPFKEYDHAFVDDLERQISNLSDLAQALRRKAVGKREDEQ